jgi:Fe(3+) dicitrate transport protein
MIISSKSKVTYLDKLIREIGGFVMFAEFTRRSTLFSIAFFTGLPGLALAQSEPLGSPLDLPQMTVLGSPEAYRELAGSGAFLSPSDLKKFDDADINAMLEDVPGIYIQEEDGYGLRPNIGMRAAMADRSSKVTVMEDGILIAPAPYAQPAAYYFPRAGRMHAVEVIKGPSAIRVGPYTVGGALNLISTPIPDTDGGVAKLRVGSDGLLDLHAYYGQQIGDWSYLLETVQEQADGFKELPSGADTGYQIGSILGKLRYAPKDSQQSLELKYEYTDEVSDETYFGLTDADFSANPFQRYAGTQEDQMDNEHWQMVATHSYQPSADTQIQTQVYQTWFDRNWYKLKSVGGSSYSSVVSDAEKFAVLKGGDSSIACLEAPDTQTCADTDLTLKANNRQYESSGFQTKVNWKWANHNLEFGYRQHTDEMTRVQWSDDYYAEDGAMVRYNAGVPGATGGSNNRFEEAEAVSYYLYDEIEMGALTISPGVRHEKIDGLRVARLTGDIEKNTSYDETLYGLGATYRLNPNLLLLAGAHDGFSATGVSNNQGETSQNYEAGLRYQNASTSFEAIAFVTDFDNLIATCTASSGCETEGDTFEGGQVDVSGLELAAEHVVDFGGRDVAMFFTYTLTEAEFGSSFEASGYDLWEEVTMGDELPYVSRHQFGLGLGAQFGNWDVHARTKYKSKQRSVAGSGAIAADEVIKSILVTDLSASRTVSDALELSLTVKNLFDNEYAVSRHPDGLRPGAPRQITIGLMQTF